MMRNHRLFCSSQVYSVPFLCALLLASGRAAAGPFAGGQFAALVSAEVGALFACQFFFAYLSWKLASRSVKAPGLPERFLLWLAMAGLGTTVALQRSHYVVIVLLILLMGLYLVPVLLLRRIMTAPRSVARRLALFGWILTSAGLAWCTRYLWQAVGIDSENLRYYLPPLTIDDDRNKVMAWTLLVLFVTLVHGAALLVKRSSRLAPAPVALPLLFLAALLGHNSTLQAAAWHPAPDHVEIPLWPGPPPNGIPLVGPENALTEVTDAPVAGKPWHMVENVVNPTVTLYAPKGRNTGVGVVVFPGGGYRILAIDLEGTEVCDWLTSQGITCLLLKYRVPGSAEHWDPVHNRYDNPKVYTALQDAQRALGIARHRAAGWNLDPHKIGVLGFSAGGHLVAATSTNFKRTYLAQDAADEDSCRPDFAVAIYPGHLWKKPLEMKTDTKVQVTTQTPPTFLLQAEDDSVDGVEQSLVYYRALKAANVPVEMHLYAQGGHAFGLRPTAFPITAWPRLVETWLRTIHMTANGS